MSKIRRIHDKVLNYLLKERRKNPDLFFTTRKRNNQQRLKKGYWFLGNDYYVHISFWDGVDWKEKIHNIGFVILHNGKSFIELSAQDSSKKAIFLEKVANELKGFSKDKSKNKWYREYSDTKYLKNLIQFISNEKPRIDTLIKKENSSDIDFIDSEKFSGYMDRIRPIRKAHIDFGRYNKIVRLCWSDNNWRFPSGSKGKSKSKDSYEHRFGFGHEEWLFDKSKIVDGYHYVFLQPLETISRKHDNKEYNISLFTTNNLDKRYYYVGEIKNAKCITKQESAKVYQRYEKEGWIIEMQKQVKLVKGKWSSWITNSPETFFNVKFQFENVVRSGELEEISGDDINITSRRYKLLSKKEDIKVVSLVDTDDLDEGNKKSTELRSRVFKGEVTFDPYHDKMQNALYELLKWSGDYQCVKTEKDRVDIKAKTNDGDWHYFEIKTDVPKLSIRKAIGQIMEYAYFPDIVKAQKLIIVSDENPDPDTLNYLDFIRKKFKIPISYKSFDLENNKLSNDY